MNDSCGSQPARCSLLDGAVRCVVVETAEYGQE